MRRAKPPVVACALAGRVAAIAVMIRINCAYAAVVSHNFGYRTD